jgi:hypothetical protein
MTDDKLKLYDRLIDILRRQVRDGDENLSDVEFVRNVWARFESSREQYLIDPNE